MTPALPMSNKLKIHFAFEYSPQSSKQVEPKAHTVWVISIETTTFTKGDCQMGQGFHGPCHSRVPTVRHCPHCPLWMLAAWPHILGSCHRLQRPPQLLTFYAKGASVLLLTDRYGSGLVSHAFNPVTNCSPQLIRFPVSP